VSFDVVFQGFISETVEACTGPIFAKPNLEHGLGDHRRVRAVLSYLQALDDAVDK
jgi:hypothetical protein